MTPWLQHSKLKKRLKDYCFETSIIGPWLFFGEKVITAVCFNEALFFEHNIFNTNKPTALFKNNGDVINWIHTIKGDLYSVLGDQIPEVIQKINLKLQKGHIFI